MNSDLPLDQGHGYTCDHCQWTGPAAELARPELEPELAFCPTCWRRGYETTPRAKLGGLMEAMLDKEPSPRLKKRIAFWSDDEWAVKQRIERFKRFHEAAPVLLETDIDGAKQLGFDWMRSEFKVEENS